MSTTRWVDRIELIQPRPVEMQVLCLGLSRTSTMTMMTALNKLGYKSYHALAVGSPEAIKNHHAACWREALEYKVNGVGAPYTGEDFDKILQNYSAVTDIPCANFANELVTRFPNAKVVLTTRDPEAWLQSVENVIYYVLSWRIWNFIKWQDPDRAGAVHDFIRLSLSDWASPHPYTDRQAVKSYMTKHTTHIRSLVPKENLLEFHPRDGWEPLCKFIGKSVPEEEFPYVNKGQNAANILKVALGIKMVKLVVPWVVGVGVVVGAWRLGLVGSPA